MQGFDAGLWFSEAGVRETKGSLCVPALSIRVGNRCVALPDKARASGLPEPRLTAISWVPTKMTTAARSCRRTVSSRDSSRFQPIAPLKPLPIGAHEDISCCNCSQNRRLEHTVVTIRHPSNGAASVCSRQRDIRPIYWFRDDTVSPGAGGKASGGPFPRERLAEFDLAAHFWATGFGITPVRRRRSLEKEFR